MTDGMSEDSAGNTLYNTREKSFFSITSDRQLWLWGRSCSVCVTRLLDKLLSFITLRFDLRWLFAVVPVPWEDKSVWEWLKCISTTKLHWHTLTVCLRLLRLAWASWLKPIDRPKSHVIVGGFSAAWHQCQSPQRLWLIPQRKLMFTALIECFQRDWCGLWNQMRCPSQVIWKHSCKGGGIWLFDFVCVSTDDRLFDWVLLINHSKVTLTYMLLYVIYRLILTDIGLLKYRIAAKYQTK